MASSAPPSWPRLRELRAQDISAVSRRSLGLRKEELLARRVAWRGEGARCARRKRGGLVSADDVIDREVRESGAQPAEHLLRRAEPPHRVLRREDDVGRAREGRVGDRKKPEAGRSERRVRGGTHRVRLSRLRGDGGVLRVEAQVRRHLNHLVAKPARRRRQHDRRVLGSCAAPLATSLTHKRLQPVRPDEQRRRQAQLRAVAAAGHHLDSAVGRLVQLAQLCAEPRRDGWRQSAVEQCEEAGARDPVRGPVARLEDGRHRLLALAVRQAARHRVVEARHRRGRRRQLLGEACRVGEALAAPVNQVKICTLGLVWVRFSPLLEHGHVEAALSENQSGRQASRAAARYDSRIRLGGNSRRHGTRAASNGRGRSPSG